MGWSIDDKGGFVCAVMFSLLGIWVSIGPKMADFLWGITVIGDGLMTISLVGLVGVLVGEVMRHGYTSRG